MGEASLNQPDLPGQPEGPEPDYFSLLLNKLGQSYDHAATIARQKKDPKQEMFYIGKRDAIFESLVHYAELKK